MTNHEMAVGQTAYALGDLAGQFQAKYPSIRRETAVEGLRVLCGALLSCATIGETTAVFRDLVDEAFDRDEPWAIDIRQAILNKEKT